MVLGIDCLAGMGVQTPRERAVLLDLLETFQKRLRWPDNSLREELEIEYQKAEKSASGN